MQLKSLQIQIAPSYQKNAGQYEGEVEFENDSGRIKLNLSPELSQRVLEVVSEQLVATSRQLATELTTQCIATIPVAKNTLLTDNG